MPAVLRQTVLIVGLLHHINPFPAGAVSTSGAAAPVRQITNPYIIEHPEDLYVGRNQPASLNCKAEGRPDPIISWYRNGQPVVTANENPKVDRTLLPNGQLFFVEVVPLRSGRNSPPSDVGVYYCNATNPETGFSVISRNATLGIAAIRDEFREHPAPSIEVPMGHEAIIRCRPPRGDPEPRVRWTKDGNPLPPPSSASPDQPAARSSPGAGGSGSSPAGPSLASTGRVYVNPTSGSLHIQETRRDDAGKYQCIAYNAAGQRESSVAQLNVREKPRIVESPKDLVAKENANVTFTCRASGDPPPTIIWNKSDGQIAPDRSYIMADRTLRIERVQISDEGIYICRAENSVGSQDAEARLTVHSLPAFIATPRDRSVGAGRQVAFRCEVTGNPPPAVFWNKDSTEAFMFPNQNHGRFTVLDDGSLFINNVRPEDGGDYVCQGLNNAGSAYAKVKLEVKATDNRLPPIIQHGPQNQTLPLGGVANLTCSVVGDQLTDVYWFKNGRVVLISKDSRYSVTESGTLQITGVTIPPWPVRRHVHGRNQYHAVFGALGKQHFRCQQREKLKQSIVLLSVRRGECKVYTKGMNQLTCHGNLRRSDTGSYTCRVSSDAGETSWYFSASLVVDLPGSSSSTVFRRAPQSNTFPGPPAKPTVSDVTTNSVRLSWRHNPNSGASPIVAYMIEYFAKNSDHQVWTIASDSVAEPPFVVRSLRSGTEYVFVVRARNTHGYSAPSGVSQPILTRGDPPTTVRPSTPMTSPVTHPSGHDAAIGTSALTVETINSTALRVSWHQLPIAGSSGQRSTEGYKVYYRSIDDGDDSAASADEYMVQIVKPGDAKFTVLSGLHPYTWYEVYVQRSSDMPPSPAIRAKTAEDFPSMAPAGIHAAMVDNTTLRLTWSRPPTRSLNGQLLGYMIYINDNATRFTREIQINGSAESIVVYHLPVSSRPTVQMSVFNRIGKSARSLPVQAGVAHAMASASNVVDEPWFLVLLIAIVSGILSVLSCIIVVVIYRKYSASRRHKEIPKQATILMTGHAPRKEAENQRMWYAESAPLTSLMTHPTTTSNHGVLIANGHARCYSNESRVSDVESRTSAQGSGLHSNGGTHLYYTLESGAAESSTEDAPPADVSGLTRPPLPGGPCTPPGLLRPIPQSYMIRPQPAAYDYDVAVARRREIPSSRQPVLFLPPPPSHLPADDREITAASLPLASNNAAAGPAGFDRRFSTARVTSQMPSSTGANAVPLKHWSTKPDVDDDLEDAATWNSGTDIDDSTRRQGSPTTDYEGTSSDCGDVFYNNANGIGDCEKPPAYLTLLDQTRQQGQPVESATSWSRDHPYVIGV